MLPLLWDANSQTAKPCWFSATATKNLKVQHFRNAFQSNYPFGLVLHFGDLASCSIWIMAPMGSRTSKSSICTKLGSCLSESLSFSREGTWIGQTFKFIFVNRSIPQRNSHSLPESHKSPVSYLYSRVKPGTLIQIRTECQAFSTRKHSNGRRRQVFSKFFLATDYTNSISKSTKEDYLYLRML